MLVTGSESAASRAADDHGGVPSLRETGRYLAHRDSLLALAVLSLVLALLEWLGTLPAVSGWGFAAARLTWALYFLLVVRQAALGSRRLPAPSDHLDTWDTLLQPLLQVLAATAGAWIAVLLLAQQTVGVRDFVERYQAQPVMFLGDRGWLGRVLLAVGAVHVPLAVAAGLVARGVGHALDPLLGLRLAARAPRAVVSGVGMLALLGLLGHVVDTLALRVHSELPIPLAAPVLSHFVRLWVPLAQARLLGDLLHLNAARLTPAVPAAAP